MAIALIICFLIHVRGVAAAVTGECSRDVDACSSRVYVALDEPTRSTAYINTSDAQHDYTLGDEWYRSVSGAGGDMPTSAVHIGQCGAYAPIWLTESFPSELDGIVDIPACASFLNNTCIRQYTIPVKNCGDFRVYCLFGVDDTFDRFCMGSELACAEGETSPNGFSPGCAGPSTVTVSSTLQVTASTTISTTTLTTESIAQSTATPITTAAASTTASTTELTTASTTELTTIVFSTTTPATSLTDGIYTPTESSATVSSTLTPVVSSTTNAAGSDKQSSDGGGSDNSRIEMIVIACTVSIVLVIIIVAVILGVLFFRRNRARATKRDSSTKINTHTFGPSPKTYGNVQEEYNDALSMTTNTNLYVTDEGPHVYEKPISKDMIYEAGYDQLHTDKIPYYSSKGFVTSAQRPMSSDSGAYESICNRESTDVYDEIPGTKLADY